MPRDIYIDLLYRYYDVTTMHESCCDVVKAVFRLINPHAREQIFFEKISMKIWRASFIFHVKT